MPHMEMLVLKLYHKLKLCCLLECHSCRDSSFLNIYALNQNINTLYNNMNILLKYKPKR